MSVLPTDYGSLLSETKPEVIHDEGQNDRFVARLVELTSKQVVTPAEEKLIELLTVLIENFEAQHYPVQGSGPLDVIRHLMEENHLRQKDLWMSLERRASCPMYSMENAIWQRTTFANSANDSEYLQRSFSKVAQLQPPACSPKSVAKTDIA